MRVLKQLDRGEMAKARWRNTVPQRRGCWSVRPVLVSTVSGEARCRYHETCVIVYLTQDWQGLHSHCLVLGQYRAFFGQMHKRGNINY